jgi:exopolysaccharide biosynthesis protein
MTTSEHKWLAEYFFPEVLIEEVMSKKVNTINSVTDNKLSTSFLERLKAKNKDILNQKHLTVGAPNEYGHILIVNDKEQKLLIYKIQTEMYTGYMTLINEPSRVRLVNTKYKNKKGMSIKEYLEDNNAILAINASAYEEKNGAENGAIVSGLTYSDDKSWGKYNNNLMSFGFTKNDKFSIGLIKNWEAHGFRDAIQFSPALIVNSEIAVSEGSGGWGLQPRTCIGQREDGVVLLLVIDGRQMGYSYGATVEDCAQEMLKYGAINAACCDGGSSSILAYDGKIINTPSTKSSEGALLPNAWVISKY